MRPHLRPMLLGLALLAATPSGTRAQSNEQLLDEVRVLTPHELRDLVDVAESGDTLAQFKVGLAYLYGYGVKSLPGEAARWFRRAAEQDCVAAQHMLGVQLRDGNGVERETEEALRLLRAAAERGHADAQYDYGLMLFDGIGVPQNHPEAYRWFTRAAEQGSVAGHLFRGLMLVNGLGVEPDPAGGHDELLYAARAGSPMAQANLGALYAYGVGVEQSDREALIWYMMAEAGGFEDAGPLIAELARTMSESSVSELRQEAQQRTERLLGASVETDTSQADYAGRSEALNRLDEWFTAQLPELGTFMITVRWDAVDRLARLEDIPTVRGRSEMSDVTLAGCRLHYVQTTLIEVGEPIPWEWYVDLAGIDVAGMQVRDWAPPEGGWRFTSAAPLAVYLVAADEYPDIPFRGRSRDTPWERVFELWIPFRDRSAVDEVMTKLREGVQLCSVP